MKNHVFIIGSKGIPAKYGGFETFVDQLTRQKESNSIFYHVSCMANEEGEFIHNESRCFNIKVPDIGSAKAVYYDLLSLSKCISYVEQNKIKNAIIYILACRIGPFMFLYKRRLRKLGIKTYVNPDGNEWRRSKWNRWVRSYWKLSEKLMVKHADSLICDSIGIEKYIKQEYKKYNPSTKYISYGADVKKSLLEDESQKFTDWMIKHQIRNKQYYLIVGRFVPENNYETIINEFIQSNSSKDLVIITNVENNSFYYQLQEKTNFQNDNRIKFVGTVYDQELLTKIREKASAYIHGHEVGGTNPSLLEALASTDINLLLDVIYNKEVGDDGAFYFSKGSGSLSELIDKTDQLSTSKTKAVAQRAREIILERYSWSKIITEYEELFTGTQQTVKEGLPVETYRVVVNK
jgi:rhamnosyltransferase